MNYSAKTLINLIIGDPVSHSLSPKLHNFLYQKLGLSENYVFLASGVSKVFLPQAISGARALGVNGLAVTIPHKSEIIGLLDEVDFVAQKIGAVNTVVNKDGLLKGYNTDYYGVLVPLLRVQQMLDYPVQEILDVFTDRCPCLNWLDFRKLPPINPKLFLKDKKIALIGAGGAARSVCFGILEAGGKLAIFNRTLAKAENLASEFAQKFNTTVAYQGLEDLNLLKNFDIVINTASNELADKQTLINKSHINNNQIIFDTVYKPGGTELTNLAINLGAKVIYGQEMLFWQGVFQCKYHLGID